MVNLVFYTNWQYIGLDYFIQKNIENYRLIKNQNIRI